jgi:hypothetical protein
MIFFIFLVKGDATGSFHKVVGRMALYKDSRAVGEAEP